jgi:hypothetical protein
MTRTQEMELWLGPGHSGSSFESDEHRREVWFRYREKLMQQWGRDGRRPFGWWRYECPEGLRFPGLAHERSILYEEAILSEEERSQLEARWRREFDRSWEPHFFFCAGPDKIFTGDVARELHWIWADLPPVLHEKWIAAPFIRSLD